jgi:hypothetical protein
VARRSRNERHRRDNLRSTEILATYSVSVLAAASSALGGHCGGRLQI